jgi:hypothetical protein
MVMLNLQTVDEVIFSNARVRELLKGSLRHVIDQWMISQKMPFLRHLRKQARLDMLNGLNQEHIRVLEEHFGTQVIIEKFDAHMVKNLEIGVGDDVELCEIEGFSDFSISRSADKIYITSWR